MPLLVPVLKKVTNLRVALYILFPGLYVLGSVLFLLSLFVLKRDLKKVQDFAETKPLLPEKEYSVSDTSPEPKLV